MTDQKEYNLNQGQKNAADAFFKFLFDDNQKEFIISGFAGVGKTYLMSYIIDNTMVQYFEMCKLLNIPAKYTSVEMTATTNKAAEVLGTSTGRPTQTIHSFMNLNVTTDFNTGKTYLKKHPRNWMVHNNRIIFIDEASMIDTDLYRMLHEGTHDCKIVYVGDHNQLAPVMEKISPVYTQHSPFYELTEQMRNSGYPDLMNVCSQLRKTVETGKFQPIKIIPGVIDLLNDDQMIQELNNKFMNQTVESRILAFTNKRVIQYNDYIRNMRQLPSSYQASELLVNNNAFKTRSGRMIGVEELVEVKKNRGADVVKIGIDPNDGSDINLAVDILDLVSSYGEFFSDVPVPTDRKHVEDLIKWFGKRKAFVEMYKLKEQYPDLRPRDAATVHKAQGSTYDSVFIDLENISTCNIENLVARMLYVAFSRAKSRVFLYGNLVQKYGGLIY